MNHLKHLFSLLSKNERKKLIIVLLGVILMGLLELAGIGSIMPFLSVASNPEMIIENQYLSYFYEKYNFASTQDFLFALGIGAVVFLIFSNATKAIVFYMNRRFTHMRRYYLSKRLFKHYLYQPYVFFLNQNTSEIMKNILGEVTKLVNGALMALLDLVTSIVISLFIIVMLVMVDPFLALISALLLGGIYSAIFILVKKKLNSLGEERVETNRSQYKKVSEALGGIKDVKILNKERFFLNDYSIPSRRFSEVQVAASVIEDIPKYLLEVISFGGILLIILYMMEVSGNFQSAVPMIGLYAFAAYRLMPPLQKTFKNISKLKGHFPVVELIYEILDGWEKKDYELSGRGKGENAIELKNAIRLKDITFTYPGSTIPIINNQSIEIQKNTTVGFVGHTGCGKTTFIDILLGLLNAQSGYFFIDDTVIDKDNVSEWQKHVGYVSQTIYLADTSIKRNIAFGVKEEDIDMDKVRMAAKNADIDKFIENEMDSSYETIIGERGIRLSGGQRQRIGIARALYHDPSILVLDEATSALDSLTERRIMTSIDTLSHKKTVVMIAHRISTVKNCDKIFLLEKGSVVDEGTYDELMENSKLFRKIAKIS